MLQYNLTKICKGNIMKDKLQFYINGQWVESDSSEKIEVINPANEDL